MTASPITDIPAVAHLKNNPSTTKTAAKSAQEIPIGTKITQYQPGLPGMSILEGILSVNDDGSDSDDSTSNDCQWVRCAKCVLDITDKTIIEHGDELTDKCIQLAQNLLKCQFPLSSHNL